MYKAFNCQKNGNGVRWYYFFKRVLGKVILLPADIYSHLGEQLIMFDTSMWPLTEQNGTFCQDPGIAEEQ